MIRPKEIAGDIFGTPSTELQTCHMMTETPLCFDS